MATRRLGIDWGNDQAFEHDSEDVAEARRNESTRPTEAPTVPPPAPISVTRFRAKVSVDELLYRMAMGDLKGAFDALQYLCDSHYVPSIAFSLAAPELLRCGYREVLFLSFVDGHTTLAETIEASGLDWNDALRVLHGLLERGVLELV